MSGRLRQDDVLEVLTETWRELLGVEEGPEILVHLAARLVDRFGVDDEVDALRRTIEWNRRTHSEELDHLNRQRLGDALSLIRIIDGVATDADRVRERWVRMTLAASGEAAS